MFCADSSPKNSTEKWNHDFGAETGSFSHHFPAPFSLPPPRKERWWGRRVWVGVLCHLTINLPWEPSDPGPYRFPGGVGIWEEREGLGLGERKL